jgi:hypothetical protein
VTSNLSQLQAMTEDLLQGSQHSTLHKSTHSTSRHVPTLSNHGASHYLSNSRHLANSRHSNSSLNNTSNHNTSNHIVSSSRALSSLLNLGADASEKRIETSSHHRRAGIDDDESEYFIEGAYSHFIFPYCCYLCLFVLISIVNAAQLKRECSADATRTKREHTF